MATPPPEMPRLVAPAAVAAETGYGRFVRLLEERAAATELLPLQMTEPASDPTSMTMDALGAAVKHAWLPEAVALEADAVFRRIVRSDGRFGTGGDEDCCGSYAWDSKTAREMQASSTLCPASRDGGDGGVVEESGSAAARSSSTAALAPLSSLAP